jgi:hypothetical protein
LYGKPSCCKTSAVTAATSPSFYSCRSILFFSTFLSFVLMKRALHLSLAGDHVSFVLLIETADRPSPPTLHTMELQPPSELQLIPTWEIAGLSSDCLILSGTSKDTNSSMWEGSWAICQSRTVSMVTEIKVVCSGWKLHGLDELDKTIPTLQLLGQSE